MSAVNYFKASRSFFSLSFSRTRSAKFIKNHFRHFPVNLFISLNLVWPWARHFFLSRFTNISTICFIASRHHNFGFLYLAFFSLYTREKIYFHFAVLLAWSVNVDAPFDVIQLFTASSPLSDGPKGKHSNLKANRVKQFFLLCHNMRTSISASNNIFCFSLWKRMTLN